MQPPANISPPAPAPAPAPPSPAETNSLTDYYPHFLTLAALIYLLGPSAASITLILSITMITTCVILRPALPPSCTSQAAAIAAAATADMDSPQEARAFYYGYMKGFEDGQKQGKKKQAAASAAGAGGGRKEDAQEDADDSRSESTSRNVLGIKGSPRSGICGPAVGWRDRQAHTFSGSSRAASSVGG